VELNKTETAGSPAAPDLRAEYAKDIAIKLPGDVAEALEKKWGDLSQYALEIIAVEGYRSGVLTPEQLHRMLSLRTRSEVDASLKAATARVLNHHI
jgi:hypothetical protein